MDNRLYFSFSNGKQIAIDLQKKLFAVTIQSPAASPRASGTNSAGVTYDSSVFTLARVTHDPSGRQWAARYEFITDSHDAMGVDLTFSLTDEEAVSSARITHTGESVVYSFIYPYIQKDDTATFDHLLFSSAWGDDLPRPTKTIRDVSTSTSIRFAQDYIRYAPDEVIYTYPSIMAMQYVVLYNENDSLYLAAYSQSDDTMTFHGKSLGKTSLGLWITHYPFLRNGSWTTPECSISRQNGGWHNCARLYAKHMSGVFHAPDSPAWMRESYHGWLERVMKFSWTGPRIHFSEIGQIYKEMAERTAMKHLWLVGWHDNGHDTQYMRYLPCEALGTPAELKEGIAGVHDNGGKVSLYTNARLVDINGVFYKNGGSNAVCLDEDGKPYLETYDSQDISAISCPGCPELMNQMVTVTGRIADEYGADGIFLDQISCNLDPFCYAPNHGHQRPSANFLNGIEKELTAVRARHRQANPEFHSFSEGCHERFNQFYDVNQGHGEHFTWQIGESRPEQFLYTFPDRIVTGICENKHQLYHSMAQGKPLDIKESCYADESTWPLVRKYVGLREDYKEFFLQGRFIDDEGFTCHSGVRVFARKSITGDLCAGLWACGADEHTAAEACLTIPEGYTPESILYAPDARMKQEGRLLIVNWTGGICFVLLKKFNNFI